MKKKMNFTKDTALFGDKIQWNSLHCNKDALTDGYGWFLQGILAALAFSCLVAKRFFEPPYIRRPWKTWWYDTSKQGIGAAVIHLTNVYLAPLYQGDPCTWYIINFLLDSTIGLFIIYIGIRICHYLAKNNKNFKSINFGEYTTSKSWIHQTIIYIFLMALIKLITTLIIQFDFWDNVKNFILSPFINPKYELAIVMLIIPFFVNIFIFWVTDNFLMRYKYNNINSNKKYHHHHNYYQHQNLQQQTNKMKYCRRILKNRRFKLFKNRPILLKNDYILDGGDMSTNNSESEMLISDDEFSINSNVNNNNNSSSSTSKEFNKIVKI